MKNEQIKNIIIKSFCEGKNSHAFLMYTNNIDHCYKYVKEIIKNINCTENKIDCQCNICHTIDEETSPDFIKVLANGKEIKKEQVSNIIKLFNTTPMTNKYSTYVILEADKLNISSSNSILKFLEEPESNIIGFFITTKLHAIIPTIRSRCEIFKINFDTVNILDYLNISENEYELLFDKSLSFICQLEENSKYKLMNDIQILSEMESNDFICFLSLIRTEIELKYNSLNGDTIEAIQVQDIINNINTNDIKVLAKRLKLLDNIIDDSKKNVNKKLLLSKLILNWE